MPVMSDEAANILAQLRVARIQLKNTSSLPERELLKRRIDYLLEKYHDLLQPATQRVRAQRSLPQYQQGRTVRPE